MYYGESKEHEKRESKEHERNEIELLNMMPKKELRKEDHPNLHNIAMKVVSKKKHYEE